MIWQLIKRDPARKFAPWLTLFGAAAGLLLPGSAHSAAGACCSFVGIGLFWCRPHERATRFEATLPIAGRQLFLARMSVMMGTMWAPAIAAVTAILISRGLSTAALEPLEIASACTLMIMLLQSVHVREIYAPHSLLLYLFPVTVASGVFAADMDAGIPASLVCATLSAALFLRVWNVIPKAFQIAPTASRAGRAEALSAGEPVTGWLPILRSVFSWQYALWLPMLFLGGMGTSWFIMFPFWLMGMWQVPRMRLRWTRVLPVSPRAVLWIILAPALLTLVGAYFAGIAFPGVAQIAGGFRRSGPVLTPREQVVTLAAILAWVLVVLLLIALRDWRRLRYVPPAIRSNVPIGAALAPAVAILAALVTSDGASTSSGLLRSGLLRLTAALPGSLAAVIALAAIPLAALYWALERVFEEGEYTDKSGEGKDGWTIPNMFNRDAAIR